MSNMGRCGQHGCAFSVRLVNGQRDEYCPECEIDRLRAALATAQAERDKWRGVCVDVGRVIDALGKDIVDLPLLVLDVVKQRDAALTWIVEPPRGGQRARDRGPTGAACARRVRELTEACRIAQQWVREAGHDVAEREA